MFLRLNPILQSPCIICLSASSKHTKRRYSPSLNDISNIALLRIKSYFLAFWNMYSLSSISCSIAYCSKEPCFLISSNSEDKKEEKSYVGMNVQRISSSLLGRTPDIVFPTDDYLFVRPAPVDSLI